MASDDETIAIQKCTHPSNGTVPDMPIGQELPDTHETLERDGLISCRRDPQGNVDALVLDPRSVRVICWQLTINADSRRRGHGDVFKDLQADLYDDFSERVQ